MTVTFRTEQNDLTNHSKFCRQCWTLQLPFEIWEQIIEEGWKAPMSIPDRNQFKFAVEKASPILCNILSRVMAKEIYTPWPNHLVCKDVYAVSSPPWPTRSRPIRRFELCRSLTRQILLSDKSTDASQHRMSQLHNLRGRPMRDVLSSFRGLPFLPNLQRFCVQYHALHSTRQLYDHHPVSHLFDVVHITVEISRITSWMLDVISNTNGPPEDDFLLVRRPYVELVSTASDEAVDHILYLCPHLELAEDVTSIDVRILESSRKFDDDCTLVHGPIHCYNVWEATDESTQPPNRLTALTVRGTCLALVVPTRRIQDGKDMAKVGSRKSHMFLRRYG